MKILVGISGGVDSAVAASMLIKQGHLVESAVVLMHTETDVASAAEVAKSLGTVLHTIDKRDAFQGCVVSNFISEYKKGRTPNPCVICNSEVKFRALYDYAMSNGFDAIATGHYARVVAIRNGEIIENTPHLIEENIKTKGFSRFNYSLALSVDDKKDQTYMLWRIDGDILSRLILPLSGEKKSGVRSAAALSQLSAADKKDSQEICFIPDNDYASFIENRVGKSECGEFIDENGAKIGEHRGIIRYTVGQRRGLGVSADARLYVTEVNPSANTVTLSRTKPTYGKIYLSDVRFLGLSGVEYGKEYHLSVKVRYSRGAIPARAVFSPDMTAQVILDTPTELISGGQSAVFYENGIVMAGGFIDKGE